MQADPPRWTVQARHARVQRAENRVDADLDGETRLRLDAHGLVTSQGTMREATAATCAFPGCFTQAMPVRRAGDTPKCMIHAGKRLPARR